MYCEICDHPVSYHTKDHGCSMPVLKGTNIPIGRNDWDKECEGCPCSWHPDYTIEEVPW